MKPPNDRSRMLTTTNMAKNKIRPRNVSKEELSRNDETDEGISKEGAIQRYTSIKGSMK